MTNDLLLKTADVLDQLAAQFDAQENTKLAAQKESRTTTLKSLSEKYSQLTGEEMTPEQLTKLSAADENSLSLFQEMLEKKANTVDSLGGPSDRPSSGGKEQPKNKKEAAQQAHEAFGEYLSKP